MDDISLDDDNSIILYEKTQLLELNVDLHLILEMFKSLDMIIMRNGEKINSIEDNIEKADTNINKAYFSIDSAKIYQNTFLFMAGTIACVSCPAISILFGVKIGVLAGVGIFTTLTMINK